MCFVTFFQVKRYIYLEAKVGEAYWEVRSGYTFTSFRFDHVISPLLLQTC